MLKVALVFVAGLLVGANVVYFLMAGRGADPDAALVFQRERTQHALPADTPRQPAARVEAPAVPLPDESTPVESGKEAAPVGSSIEETRTSASTPKVTTGPPTTTAADPGPTSGTAGLVVPVRGITAAQLSNTFDDARGEGRVHEALDIMAPRGTPVLAVADGTVEKLFDSDRGGLTIYQFEPTGRRAYYYAHLDRYAAGLEEGDTLRQGEVIGYVGSTGNASEDAPHLHFAIFVLGPEKRWWEGTAINPYPILVGKQ